MTLQSQEIVPEEKRRRINNQSACNEESMITSYSKHHEFSVGFNQTHLSLRCEKAIWFRFFFSI